MTERSDAFPDDAGSPRRTGGGAAVDPDDETALTIVTDDDTVTFAVRAGLEADGSTTEWLSIDTDHVVDVRERQ